MAGSYNTTGYRNADGIPVVQGQTAVTQITSTTTGVTCNAYSGVITTFAQSVAAGGEVDFVVTNNKVAATDIIDVCIKTHTSAGTFIAAVATVAAGSFTIRLTNLHSANAGDALLVLNFIVHKAEA
jgi:hypothetical protein